VTHPAELKREICRSDRRERNELVSFLGGVPMHRDDEAISGSSTGPQPPVNGTPRTFCHENPFMTGHRSADNDDRC
jgi:hypothetical protein